MDRMSTIIQKATAKLPAPTPTGEVVYYDVLDLISQADIRCVQHKDDIMLMVRNRSENCAKEYGQPLYSHDGRDTQAEIVQEIIDCLNYLTKAYLQTGNAKFLLYFNLELVILNELMDETIFEITKVADDTN